jgi:hypothetical protein
MTIPPTCSACAWVTAQLGYTTPCPWHAGAVYIFPTDRADLAAVSVSARPTTDQPWPFTSREYARLLLLRARVQQQRGARRPAEPLT